MDPSIRSKLERIAERFTEISALLSRPEVQANQGQYRRLSREYAQIEPVVERFTALRDLEREADGAREMLGDPEMRELAQDALTESERRLALLEPDLQRLLIPPDPDDERNVFLEIRAGTGGAEAALFAGDLLRMYLRYAEARDWRAEPLSESTGDQGGYKEVICRISGRGVYARLKFEAGTHRVQRIPQTESQGRIHTSACTVAVLPEAEEIDEIAIGARDLRVDTFRSSGAGGQHVNVTDSAVRIAHLPTGIVVECQDERSQHKNRARAMALLRARLLARAREEQTSAQAQSRRLQVGSGDRSERIRTYNFPQNRVTDHRINLTLYRLDDIAQGDLDPLIEALIQEHQAEQLASLAEAAH